MEKKDNYSAKVGRFIGNVFVSCLAACICAIAIALTVRFITWIF